MRLRSHLRARTHIANAPPSRFRFRRYVGLIKYTLHKFASGKRSCLVFGLKAQYLSLAVAVLACGVAAAKPEEATALIAALRANVAMRFTN